MKSLQSLTQIKDIDELSNALNQSWNSTVVSIQEAEALVSSLQEFPVDEIGCSSFMKMYAYDLERLSLQAHICAKREDGDEYVVEAILTHRKLKILIKTLLAIEAWRRFVLDPIKEVTDHSEEEDFAELSTTHSFMEKLAENKSSLRCAFILHAETSLCGLINLVLYRKENAAEMDNDCSVALVDYCARQMVSYKLSKLTHLL